MMVVNTLYMLSASLSSFLQSVKI